MGTIPYSPEDIEFLKSKDRDLRDLAKKVAEILKEGAERGLEYPLFMTFLAYVGTERQWNLAYFTMMLESVKLETFFRQWCSLARRINEAMKIYGG